MKSRLIPWYTDLMENRLTIKVCGSVNAGKSTLARELEAFLRARGFTNVRINDPDVVFPGYDDVALHEKRRETIIAKDTEIEIETVQVRRPRYEPLTVDDMGTTPEPRDPVKPQKR